MTRSEIIYKLKHKGYTFKRLGELFRISRQFAYSIYWRHWKIIKDNDQNTCDLCDKYDPETVGWKWRHYKLCGECEKEVAKIKRKQKHRKDFEKLRIKNGKKIIIRNNDKY